MVRQLLITSPGFQAHIEQLDPSVLRLARQTFQDAVEEPDMVHIHVALRLSPEVDGADLPCPWKMDPGSDNEPGILAAVCEGAERLDRCRQERIEPPADEQHR